MDTVKGKFLTMNLIWRAVLVLVGSVHFSKYIGLSSFSARIFFDFRFPFFRFLLLLLLLNKAIYFLVYVIICYFERIGTMLNQNKFLLCRRRLRRRSSRRQKKMPLDSSEYIFLNITKLFHQRRLAPTHIHRTTQTHARVLLSNFFFLLSSVRRSFSFFFIAALIFDSIGIWFLYAFCWYIAIGRRTATHADYFRRKKNKYHSLAPGTDKISPTNGCDVVSGGM